MYGFVIATDDTVVAQLVGIPICTCIFDCDVDAIKYIGQAEFEAHLGQKCKPRQGIEPWTYRYLVCYRRRSLLRYRCATRAIQIGFSCTK
jgi:hypothetical protein